ncbi:hypothetical protein GCM10009754_58540 [Amycolatopsis minnesotensis]|uniref:Uncharacterized protein n=1 Tax=Amycolatopsis minnesotensis TaxID=337894 RepID=A0ABN2RV24_9PSEU
MVNPTVFLANSVFARKTPDSHHDGNGCRDGHHDCTRNARQARTTRPTARPCPEGALHGIQFPQGTLQGISAATAPHREG